MQDRILWSSDREDYATTLDDLVAGGDIDIEPSDEGREQMISDLVEGDFAEIISQLDIQLDNSIIAVATLGLWDGERRGYKEFSEGNIAKAVQSVVSNSDYNDVEILIEQDNLVVKGHHHDGTNKIIIREARNAMAVDRLASAITKQKDIDQAIVRYSRSVAPAVEAVIGG